MANSSSSVGAAVVTGNVCHSPGTVDVDDLMFNARSQEHDFNLISMSSRRYRPAPTSSPTPSTSSLIPNEDDATMADLASVGYQDSVSRAASSQMTDKKTDHSDAVEGTLLISPSDGHGQSNSPVAPVARRRAVDASDLRQCALVQTKMKAWKSG